MVLLQTLSLNDVSRLNFKNGLADLNSLNTISIYFSNFNETVLLKMFVTVDQIVMLCYVMLCYASVMLTTHNCVSTLSIKIQFQSYMKRRPCIFTILGMSEVRTNQDREQILEVLHSYRSRRCRDCINSDRLYSFLQIDFKPCECLASDVVTYGKSLLYNGMIDSVECCA